MATKGNCPFLVTAPIYVLQDTRIPVGGSHVVVVSEPFRKEHWDLRAAVFSPNKIDIEAGLQYISAKACKWNSASNCVRVKFCNTSRISSVTLPKGSVMGNLVWGLRSVCYEDQYLEPLPDEKLADQVVHLDRHHNDWRAKQTTCLDHDKPQCSEARVLYRGPGALEDSKDLLADHALAIRKYQEGVTRMNETVATMLSQGKGQDTVDAYKEETLTQLQNLYIY